MRFLSLWLAVLIALAVAHAGTPTVEYTHAFDHVAYVAPINEDSPGWICWSMGNHRCSRTPLAHAGLR